MNTHLFDHLARRFASLALVALALASLPAHAQRVALLVGNANYSVGRLTNPPNDVAAMEAALNKLGFKVQKVLNANQNQLKRAVRDFGTAAQGAEVAFMYYSGHGIQAQGENYLLPIGAAIDKESDYGIEAVSANEVLRQIQGARPQAAILVLDACRDNPMAAVTRSATKGLGRMDAPTGTMIAFATAPNTTASDNGDYAKVLAREMQKPGQELVDVFRKTTAEVRRLSGGKQEPRISEMSITEPLYLAGPGTQVASVAPVPTGQPVQRDPEADAWDMAQRANTAAVYNAFLTEFPNGRFASTARIALSSLRANAEPAPAPAPAAAALPPPDPATDAAFAGKVVRIIVPFAAGGTADVATRQLAAPLGRSLGATVVIDNRPGANGAIGTAELTRSAPDGLTLLYHNTGFVSAPLLYNNASYAITDVEPVGLAVEEPLVVVARPGKSIAQARTYANSGFGTISHYCGSRLSKTLNPQVMHVPYKGMAPAIVDVIEGQVDIACFSASPLLSMLSAGKLQALGVTAPTSLPALAGVAQLSGSLSGGITDWQGLFAPKGTPAAIVNRLNLALRQASQDPAYVQSHAANGRTVVTDTRQTPAGFRQFLSDESGRWAAARLNN